MAYGKRSRSFGRKRTRGARKKAMVPVPKKAKTTRSYTRTTALAVNRNAKLINELKMSQYGCVQKNFQVSRATVTPFNGRPILFDLTDFSKADPTAVGGPVTGALWYQYSAGGTLQTINQWTSAPLGLNPYFLGVNKDIPDSGKMYQMWQKTVLKIEGSPNIDDTRVRIDVFRAKARAFTPNSNLTTTLILPNALNHFGGLADNTNRISSTYYSKVMTKWVYLNSGRPTGGMGATQGTTGNSRYVTIYTKLNRVRTQNIGIPYNPNVQNPEFQEGSWGPLNSGISAPLWACVSCQNPDSTGDNVLVSASRTVVWRDPQGQANVF